MEPVEGPVKVLYVMGSGRSGSTLLDIVLGAHPDVFGAGELTSARGSWISNRYCSCGHRVDECPFWSEVRREWAARVGGDEVARYLALQDAFEPYARWPKLWLQRRNPTDRFRTYARYAGALFEAIRETSGKSMIVDSSKNPSRAFALSMVSGIDLYIVHLTRDGRGVVMSLINRNQKLQEKRKAGTAGEAKVHRVWRMAAFWIAINLISEWVRRQIGAGRSVHVRYEDFMADPRGSLERIGRMVGVDFTEVAASVCAGEPVAVEHNIGGNRRVRMSGSVTLRPEAGEWRDKLPRKEQVLSRLLMGPLLRRYGYEK